MANVAVTWN